MSVCNTFVLHIYLSLFFFSLVPLSFNTKLLISFFLLIKQCSIGCVRFLFRFISLKQSMARPFSRSKGIYFKTITNNQHFDSTRFVLTVHGNELRYVLLIHLISFVPIRQNRPCISIIKITV